jgi:hypothetical protein
MKKKASFFHSASNFITYHDDHKNNVCFVPSRVKEDMPSECFSEFTSAKAMSLLEFHLAQFSMHVKEAEKLLGTSGVHFRW